MKEIFTVMKFTMKEMLKRKAFIISTIIILVMIVIGFNIPKIIKSAVGERVNQKLLIVDSQNIFEIRDKENEFFRIRNEFRNSLSDKENQIRYLESQIKEYKNSKQVLESKLNSIVNQETNFKYEVLVHDDCSIDNSKLIIEKFYKNYPDKIVPSFATHFSV